MKSYGPTKQRTSFQKDDTTFSEYRELGCQPKCTLLQVVLTQWPIVEQQFEQIYAGPESFRHCSIPQSCGIVTANLPTGKQLWWSQDPTESGQEIASRNCMMSYLMTKCNSLIAFLQYF